MTKEELKKHYNKEYFYALEHLPKKHKYCKYCDGLVILNDEQDGYYCPSCDGVLDNDEVYSDGQCTEIEFQQLVFELVNTLHNYKFLDAKELFNKTADLCKEFNDYSNDCKECPLSKSNNGMDISCKGLIYTYPTRFEGLVRQWMNKDYHDGVGYIRELIHNNKELERYATNKFNRQFNEFEFNKLKMAVASNRLKENRKESLW